MKIPTLTASGWLDTLTDRPLAVEKLISYYLCSDHSQSYEKVYSYSKLWGKNFHDPSSFSAALEDNLKEYFNNHGIEITIEVDFHDKQSSEENNLVELDIFLSFLHNNKEMTLSYLIRTNWNGQLNEFYDTKEQGRLKALFERINTIDQTRS